MYTKIVQYFYVEGEEEEAKTFNEIRQNGILKEKKKKQRFQTII
jgi:hypothetical protein